MPQIQIFPEQIDVQKQMNNQIMGTLGQGLGSFISHRNANKALESVLSDPSLKDAPVSQRLDKLTRALSPYGEVGQGILAARLGVEQQAKQEKQQSLTQSILAKRASGKIPTEEEFAQLDPKSQMDLIEMDNKIRLEELKNQNKVTPTQSAEAKRTSAILGKIEEGYVQAVGREGLYDSLDALIEKTSGFHLNPFGEDAAQLESLGLAAIEAPLKMFNPVGAIPTAKMKLVESKFAPKFWDTTATKKGKMAALRIINQKAIEMGERLQDLKDQYPEGVPMKELLKFQNEGVRFINELERQKISDLKFLGVGEQPQDQPPPEYPASQFPGQTITSPDGKVFKSDGNNWIPQ